MPILINYSSHMGIADWHQALTVQRGQSADRCRLLGRNLGSFLFRLWLRRVRLPEFFGEALEWRAGECLEKRLRAAAELVASGDAFVESG
jgi:hypothetical protein